MISRLVVVVVTICIVLILLCSAATATTGVRAWAFFPSPLVLGSPSSAEQSQAEWKSLEQKSYGTFPSG
jgi:hypothetical protein